MHHTEICLSFPDETAAERGLALFRDMIRTAYAGRKKMFPAETCFVRFSTGREMK